MSCALRCLVISDLDLGLPPLPRSSTESSVSDNNPRRVLLSESPSFGVPLSLSLFIFRNKGRNAFNRDITFFPCGSLTARSRALCCLFSWSFLRRGSQNAQVALLL